MLKKIIIAIVAIVVLSSCVSSKIYKELDGRYKNLKAENRDLYQENEKLLKEKNALSKELAQLQKAYKKTESTRDSLQLAYTSTRENYENLKNSYDALEKNSSAAIAENSKKNRELLATLAEKESALNAESIRLETLKQALNERSKRVADLERIVATKDAAMSRLKEAISRALTDFQDKGLTVEKRDGKVYVSMENKLLFNSGSWAVGPQGRRAVKQLGKVLGTNPDIAVLIEGHTDNVPYKGMGPLTNNWDLSTKRATAIVNILRENKDINPENLTAAGRGEYAPIATNDTSKGRSKNRRIEVILTPKLDELSKLLNDSNKN